ncbi:bacteriohemerythrin [Porticoccus sp.]
MLDHHHIPQVDLEFMNQDHQETLVITNRLEELLTGSSPLDQMAAIDGAFFELLNHHHRHFDRENREMEKYGFPAYELHLAEHRHLLADMDMELQHWLKNRDLVRAKDYVLTEFPQWLMNHLVNMDTVSATYISRVRHQDLDQAEGF